MEGVAESDKKPIYHAASLEHGQDGVGAVVFGAEAKDTIAAVEALGLHDCLVFEVFDAEVFSKVLVCDGRVGDKWIQADGVQELEALEIS